MESKNEDISKLILLIDHAVQTYKEVSNKYADDYLENFFQELSKNHRGFMRRAGIGYDISDDLPIKNQQREDAIFDKESAIDQLILCKELEKAILAQAREAVHNNHVNNKQKQLLCRQLTFSENALFKADQMLEIYE